MLPRRFHKAIGRPKGTYLSNLPSELRGELFKYSTKCDYRVSLQKTDNEEDEVHLMIEGNGTHIDLLFDIQFMSEQSGVDQFIDDIFKNLRVETGESSLRTLRINYNTNLNIERNRILILINQIYTGVSFDICAEIVEALSTIHQMVRDINVSEEMSEEMEI